MKFLRVLALNWTIFLLPLYLLHVNSVTAQTNKTGCGENDPLCKKNDNSTCIPPTDGCDKVPDCLSNKDGKDCQELQCPKNQFKCANGLCISQEVVCDFKNDCVDGSDEVNCNHRECQPPEFMCDNKECIRPWMVCDGIPDCKDQSDETGCLAETCDSGKRIHQTLKCNGWQECEDEKDELNCHCDTTSGKFFRCPNKRCIRKSSMCDGICDCVGEDYCFDERYCSEFYHFVNGFRMCKKGKAISCETTVKGVRVERCIGHEFVCDGFHDCIAESNSFSDEYGCTYESDKSETTKPDFIKDHYFACGGLDRRNLPRSAVCNYRSDCLNGEDEQNCSWQKCPDDEFQCKNGMCIPKTDRCNTILDCSDKSDEMDCKDNKCLQVRKIENSNKTEIIRRCDSGQCLSSKYWCDFIEDCSDGTDETNCGRPRNCTADEFKCETLNQCIPKSLQCYDDGNPRLGCIDRSHLKDCANFTCPKNTFKCKMGPCLKKTLLCDGKYDCSDYWTDEENCVHECFDSCICSGMTVNCTGVGFPTIKNLDTMENMYLRFYFANNNLSLTLNAEFIYQLRFAIFLDLSNNSIRSLTPGLFKHLKDLTTLMLQYNCITMLQSQTFDGLSNLRILHLEGNQIQVIEKNAFYGLSSLPLLNLSEQHIKHIEEGAFRGLKKLNNLNLTHNKIEVLQHGTFDDLYKLTHLDLRDNPLSKVESETFTRPGLSIQVLLFDNFQFCCLAKNVPNCRPISDEFSVCEDLMGNFVLRVCIWILGLLASLGNLLVVTWRISYKHKNKVHSFLITNLAVGDFLMGFYLLIIASADSHYRGVYFLHDEEWRNSNLCSLAGFLSTLSSELSVFTLILITLESFLVIMFPFKVTRLEMTQIRWVTLGVWIAAVSLSGLPLIYKDYFKNFYGRTAVCLALCVATDKNTSWKYAAFLFIILNFISLLVIAVGYMSMYAVARTTRLAVAGNIESKKTEQAMARRMILIVVTDAMCWVPIIIIGILALNGISVPPQIFAWIAVFVLPLNAAVNPIFYTISTTTFLAPAKRNIQRFNNSLRFPSTSCARTTYDKLSVTTRFANCNTCLKFWRPKCYNGMDNIELVNTKSSDGKPECGIEKKESPEEKQTLFVIEKIPEPTTGDNAPEPVKGQPDLPKTS